MGKKRGVPKATQGREAPHPGAGLSCTQVNRCGRRAAADAFPLMLAVRPMRKARGFLLTTPTDDALLLMPCSDVHTVGMRHRLDIAFVDETGIVMESHRDVGGFRRLRRRGAAAVVERFSSCSAPWFKPGDRMGMVCMKGEQS